MGGTCAGSAWDCGCGAKWLRVAACGLTLHTCARSSVRMRMCTRWGLLGCKHARPLPPNTHTQLCPHPPHVAAQGWIRTTFLDTDMRVGRGDKKVRKEEAV